MDACALPPIAEILGRSLSTPNWPIILRDVTKEMRQAGDSPVAAGYAEIMRSIHLHQESEPLNTRISPAVAGLVRFAALVAIATLSFAGNSARAEINVVRDLGCKLDDFNFDNGPILNAAFARVGKASLGQLNEEFYLPGGALVFKTPLELPKKTGMSIRGNGITDARAEGAFHNVNGGPASRLVYIGPPDKPAITYRGWGMKFDGITIQRGQIPQPPGPAQRDGSVGLMIAGDANPGTGKIYAPQLSILNFDTAIYASAIPHETHADQNFFGQLWVQNCWTVFRSDNFQSVGNYFQHLMVNGACDTVFDIRRGGDLVVDFLILNNPALLFKFRDLDGTVCSYEIRSMKIDNACAGWRLIEMQKPGQLRFRVFGHISRHATPAPDAIRLMGNLQPRDVEVDLWWEGKHWPEDFPGAR
jgi:hypothetical protein